MNKEKVYDKKVEKIIKNENVLCLLLIGAGAKTEKRNFNTLKDIDLFVITDEDYDFEREVMEIEGVLFDISYMSFNSFKKGIDDKKSFLIKALQSYRVVYNINKDIEKLLDKIGSIYKNGPGKLKDHRVDYIRFKLYQDYDDILSRKDDIPNAIFLMNNLFYNILTSYFKLKGLWIPKDKKLLESIQKVDDILYNLSVDFIKEKVLSVKLKGLYKIVDYVLTPYGGAIKFWERRKFPLL